MAEKHFYGGQAVIEGVMMRGQKMMATAVRKPDGEIVVDAQPLPTIYTGRWRKTPFTRGVIVMLEAMVLGIKTLFYSANVALGEEQEKLSSWYIWLTVSVALAFSVLVFFLAPLFITNLINDYLPSSFIFNLVEGIIRLALFVLYIKLVTLAPDIKRVFAYHGAEHKTVHAHEAGVPLEVAEVEKFNTAHVRCGTSFLFLVMLIAILVFSLVGRENVLIMAISRVVLLPVIASLSYEVTYFGARHTNNLIIRAILKPGLWLQAFTTRQPDDKQLEVAIAALKKVIDDEQGETKTTAENQIS